MIIRLEDIRLHANHGVYDFERQDGNEFRVDVSMEMENVIGISTDQLEDTLNYQLIYDVVKREMLIHSDLLEHVAGRIQKALQTQFQQAKHIEVSVAKRHPLLDKDNANGVGWSTVVLK